MPSDFDVPDTSDDPRNGVKRSYLAPRRGTIGEA